MKFSSSAVLALSFLLSTSSIMANDQANENEGGIRGGTRDKGNNSKESPVARKNMAVQSLLPVTPTESTRRVIVRYREGCKEGTMAAVQIASDSRNADEPEIKVELEFDEFNTVVMTGTQHEIEMIENNEDVLDVEEDQLRFPMHIDGSNHADLEGLFNGRSLQDVRPYGVDLVQAPALWAKGATGQGVRVCVIDSGIQSDHPDFVEANLSGDGSAWFQDGCGHGTHVSGTISGRDDERGIIGVAPDAEIFTVRVFGNTCGFAFSSGVFEAASICQQNGADVISMSLGGPNGSNFENRVFSSIFEDNILLVAAAGNGGDTSFSYPASYSSVMSVGALDRHKRLARFSQRNGQVELAAPGVGVLSTFPQGGCSICGGNRQGYGAIDGTSMATPHVSGVAALLKSAVPSASATQIRLALRESAEDLGEAGYDTSFGFGLVQAETALNVLTGTEGSESGAPMCTDIPGWSDSEGPEFDCTWYGQKRNCDVYGDSFENEGFTANGACCACGGGQRN